LAEIDMGALRERMEREMVLRRLALRTRQAYIAQVTALSKHYRRSPDLLTEQEIQRAIGCPLARRGGWSSPRWFVPVRLTIAGSMI
jgi:hypothetical protein